MAFQFGKGVFDSKAQQSALDATALKYDKLTIAQQRTTASTVSFSGAQGRGTITMENFGRTFSNATKKVLMWQLAIMAVYGVIRKVGETIQTWKDLEVTLARISITTGALGSTLQAYFKDVAAVAIEFGMPIEETLTGMDLALRATARYAEQANRGAIAVTLLKDASALANIAGMQYSQAIDILVGSLRQSGMELNQGIELLDKWVAVAKNAAVSVNDLSQGFAIMADAGRAAGLTVDQINGLIAALSETVTLGPVQIGNAIRALMSTLYNPGSISLMQKFGVAVRDTQGEIRSFWEVMEQLSAMRLAGVLDESIWLEIAKAAGAGQRRYAQFLALLNNFTSAMRTATISANAEGQAMAANQKIVDTLTNTWDKFTASQRKFLFVMGSQAGAIEDLTGALQSLTNFFNTLTGASDGVFKLGRAVMFLVGTLTALKISTLAMGWMGVGPKVGGVLGRFAGVRPSAVAGSAAYSKAIQAGGYTNAQQAAQAGLGTVAPGISSQAGLYALSGLLPVWMMRRMWTGGPAPTIPGIEATKAGGGTWRPGMGAGRGGGRWTAPIVAPMTWPGVGRGASRWLSKPMGGMGRTIGGLAAGAAAYGLTGEWESAAGAGIGAAIGAAFGPLGMVIGAGMGTLIGHTAADAFMSTEDRIRNLFTEISEKFTIDLTAAEEKYFGKIADITDPKKARKLSMEAAAEFPETMLARNEPLWKRLLGGITYPFGPEGDTGSPLGVANFAPFGRQGETEWTKGLGAQQELEAAKKAGIITEKEYDAALKETYIDWTELTDVAKAYISVIRGATIADDDRKAALNAISETILEQITRTRELSQVSNEYTVSQQRIKELMETTGAVISGMTLKEWEQQKITELLGRQLKLTAEEYKAYYVALLGSSYGYAAHIEAIERIQSVSKEFGITLEKIPLDKWLLIQKWDLDLATDIVQTTTSVASLTTAIRAFEISFPDILRLADVEGTVDDISRIIEELEKLQEAAGDPDKAKEYAAAIAEAHDYTYAVMQRDIDIQKAGALVQVSTGYTPPTEIRLVDADKLKAYREQLGQLPTLVALAESLKKFDESIITLVDPITKEVMRLESNTLALQMLGTLVNENTSALEKGLEAEYNLPSGYQTPTRYWALKQTGGSEGFGPAQEGLWAQWMEFVRGNSMQTGGIVPQTGAYYLHKKEVVISGETMSSTNSILSNSYRVLIISQQYLSNINLGILGVRQELSAMKQLLYKIGDSPKEVGASLFKKQTDTGYIGQSSLGIRR